MSGYIHSGVAGKMDKIRNANPGTILVTDKFGNAVESNVTLNDIAASGSQERYAKFFEATWTGPALISPQTYSTVLANEFIHGCQSLLVEYISHGCSFVGGYTQPSGGGYINLEITVHDAAANDDVIYYTGWKGILYREEDNLGIRAVCELDISSGFGKLFNILNADENSPASAGDLQSFLPVRKGYTFVNAIFQEGSYIKTIKFSVPESPKQTEDKYITFLGDTVNFYRRYLVA